MWGSDWEMCTGRVYLSTFEVTFWKAQSLRDKGCIQKMMSHQTKKLEHLVSLHPSFSLSFIAEQNTEPCAKGQGQHKSAFTLENKNYLYSHAKWHVC